MRRRLAVLVALLLPLTLALIIAAQLADRPPDRTGSIAPSPSPRAARRAPPGAKHAVYDLRMEQRVTAPGRPDTTLLVTGQWRVAPTAAGNDRVRLVAAELRGPAGELPTADALAAASAELSYEDGVLTKVGFTEQTPAVARRLLTGVATAFQLTAGSGDQWSAIEEDLTGRYQASYTQAAPGAISRVRERYLAVRGADGALGEGGTAVTARETSRFALDDEGLASADVALDLSLALPNGLPAISLAVRGKLVRRAFEPGAVAQDELPAAPISTHVDLDAVRRNADLVLLAGATLEDVLAELSDAAARPSPAGPRDRAQLLAKLAAHIRVTPGAAARLAAILRGAGPLAEARTIAGALSSSRVVAGTDALAGVLGADLPDERRALVLSALSLSAPVTLASLGALERALDAPIAEHAAQAALGLGTHARKLAAEQPRHAAQATDELLLRLERAGSLAARRHLLAALGNAGDARGLPALLDAIATADRDTASAAVFGLRFVAGAAADAALDAALGRRETVVAAARAIGYRDAARWRSRLADAAAAYPAHDILQSEIRAILQRWG